MEHIRIVTLWISVICTFISNAKARPIVGYNPSFGASPAAYQNVSGYIDPALQQGHLAQPMQMNNQMNNVSGMVPTMPVHQVPNMGMGGYSSVPTPNYTPNISSMHPPGTYSPGTFPSGTYPQTGTYNASISGVPHGGTQLVNGVPTIIPAQQQMVGQVFPTQPQMVGQVFPTQPQMAGHVITQPHMAGQVMTQPHMAGQVMVGNVSTIPGSNVYQPSAPPFPYPPRKR